MFTLWLGYCLIKVYDNFLPDNFADDIENLHTRYNFDWYRAPNTGVFPEEGDWKKFEDSGITFWKKNGIIQGFMDNRTLESPQFCHVFYDKIKGSMSDYTSEVENILKYVYTNPRKVSVDRIKSNLNVNLTGYKEENYLLPHTDSSEDTAKSLLYYVNDSDGDTYFFDRNMNIVDTVSPKKNRAILFSSNILHAGSNPIRSNKRMVINIIFEDIE